MVMEYLRQSMKPKSVEDSHGEFTIADRDIMLYTPINPYFYIQGIIIFFSIITQILIA